MRFAIWVVTGICALWASPAVRAQSTTQAATILGGPNLSAVTYRPVDLSNTIAPTPAIAAGQSRFSFAGLFSKLSMPGFPAKRGISPLPPPGSFPSTQYGNYQMVGKPPLMLGKPKPNTFIPPVPFAPSVATPVGPGSGQ